tara:strand:+ start:3566 stop:3844 length:279 start_codon:yes stop_codon:yes gene_type:complete
MVKKHLQKININKDYNFISIVENLYNIELKHLHTKKEKEYELFTEIGKDYETEFHNKFYNKLREGWEEIQTEYDNFIINEILPFLNLEDAMV